MNLLAEYKACKCDSRSLLDGRPAKPVILLSITDGMFGLYPNTN